MAATLQELYSIRFNKDNLQNRTAAALLQQAWDIVAEDANTSNHLNRRAWAKGIIEGDLTEAAYATMGWVAKSTAIQNNGVNATDNHIKTAVTEALPHLVPDAIPTRPDMTGVAPEVINYIIALENALNIG